MPGVTWQGAAARARRAARLFQAAIHVLRRRGAAPAPHRRHRRQRMTDDARARCRPY
jgi:hypothetical protein